MSIGDTSGEVVYLRRRNLGNYEHEEASCKVGFVEGRADEALSAAKAIVLSHLGGSPSAPSSAAGSSLAGAPVPVLNSPPGGLTEQSITSSSPSTEPAKRTRSRRPTNPLNPLDPTGPQEPEPAVTNGGNPLDVSLTAAHPDTVSPTPATSNPLEASADVKTASPPPAPLPASGGVPAANELVARVQKILAAHPDRAALAMGLVKRFKKAKVAELDESERAQYAALLDILETDPEMLAT